MIAPHTSPHVVIMAAGKGTRMKSAVPKVLQKLGGTPLIAHVVRTALGLSAQNITVVTGHQAQQVEDFLTDLIRTTCVGAPIKTVRQEPQLGTGHCALQAAPFLPDDDSITLVLSGDVPLTQLETLRALSQQCAGKHLALLTVRFDHPTGYGRIVRNEAGEQVLAIVEEKDANAQQKQICECYSGIMAAPTRLLKRWLLQLDNQNASGEFYLTDIVKHAVGDGTPVLATCIDNALEVTGVNSAAQLAFLERALQTQTANTLMDQGVRLADPGRFDVRGVLTCGQDVEIDINCVFAGQVTLGDNVRIGAHCVISHAVIHANSVIQPFTHIEGNTKEPVQIGCNSKIGPFARLRPGTCLAEDVHIGNFVEIKNATLGAGAKANHLAYLGDASVGERVNYGAGSITANYDGFHKHKTVIEADVHVGSNCVLAAPVTLGKGGTIGAGSTITKDTPEYALTLERNKQVSLANWQRGKTPRKT